MFTTLERAKQHINVDADYQEDDSYIISLICAAEDAIAKRLNVKNLGCLLNKETGYLPEDVNHSVLLLVGTWYANRESVSNQSANNIPYTLDFLFDINKNYRSPF